MKCAVQILLLLVVLSLGAHAAEGGGVELATHAGAGVVQENSGTPDATPQAGVAHFCHASAHAPALAVLIRPMRNGSKSVPIARDSPALSSVYAPPVTPPPIG